ncbi:hypothetical protein [Streptomyces sp. ISID311]|uniref:DUF6923 family protein n=1 Tax=Streptomyces sp. ISID311 TaxID=2601673 RepID=UPI0011BD42F8|nr:hypothetical protein [Streptomyces sp. ISID311]TXC99487.1 hypothetical protein FS847_04115 [Streptomyces sp. ISID311]
MRKHRSAGAMLAAVSLALVACLPLPAAAQPPHAGSVRSGNQVTADEGTLFLAVGQENTDLYTFDADTAETHRISAQPYAPGYGAMGYRKTDNKLYSLQRHGCKLVVIDPDKGNVQGERDIEGLDCANMTGQVWFDGDIDSDGNLVVAGISKFPSYKIDLADPSHPKAIELNRSRPGKWDDWALHPKDGRLYAVVGKADATSSNGELIYTDDQSRAEMKTLGENVFPKAESPDERKAFSAAFFDEDGRLFAMDAKGNVYQLNDLTQSTKEHPVDHVDTGAAQRIPGQVQVGGKPIVNAARVVKSTPHPDYALKLDVAAGEGTKDAFGNDPVTYTATVTNHSKGVNDAYLQGTVPEDSIGDVKVTGCRVTTGSGTCVRPPPETTSSSPWHSTRAPRRASPSPGRRQIAPAQYAPK